MQITHIILNCWKTIDRGTYYSPCLFTEAIPPDSSFNSSLILSHFLFVMLPRSRSSIEPQKSQIYKYKLIFPFSFLLLLFYLLSILMLKIELVDWCDDGKCLGATTWPKQWWIQRGGGGGSSSAPPSKFWSSLFLFKIPFCIRMLKNKAQKALESIKTPRACSALNRALNIRAHNLLRAHNPPL